jgi:hypothetical protein
MGARGFKVTPEPSPLPLSAQTCMGVSRPVGHCLAASPARVRLSWRESAHNPPHYEMSRTNTCIAFVPVPSEQHHRGSARVTRTPGPPRPGGGFDMMCAVSLSLANTALSGVGVRQTGAGLLSGEEGLICGGRSTTSPSSPAQVLAKRLSTATSARTRPQNSLGGQFVPSPAWLKFIQISSLPFAHA